MSFWADKIIAVRTDKTIYRDGSSVIKLFDKDHSKSDVLCEAMNQARAEEAGLIVPAVLEVIPVDGKWGIRSVYVSGRTLQQLMDERPAQNAVLLERLIALQMEVHLRTCPKLVSLKDEIRDRIGRADLDPAVRRKLTDELEQMPERENFCHGDLNPSNVIAADSGQDYLVDWPHAARGDAAADAALTYLSFYLHAGVPEAETYMKLYCEKTGTERQQIERWRPLAAAALSVESRAAEREILLRCVNQNEYN